MSFYSMMISHHKNCINAGKTAPIPVMLPDGALMQTDNKTANLAADKWAMSLTCVGLGFIYQGNQILESKP